MQKNNSNLYSWKSAAASVVGFDHIASDLPCQDAYAVAELDDGIIICVVCDGAGSAKNAELGSRLISESIVRNRRGFYANEFKKNRVLNANLAAESAFIPSPLSRYWKLCFRRFIHL